MILSPGIFVKKILFNKSIYFGYCITLYLLLSFIFIEVTSTIVAEILAESFASVLLAYWIAKMITRFKEVQTFITPVVFLYVHLAAMDDSVYILNGETEGVPFTMWTLGIALILFIIAQLSLKIGMITTLLFFPALFLRGQQKAYQLLRISPFCSFRDTLRLKPECIMRIRFIQRRMSPLEMVGCHRGQGIRTKSLSFFTALIN